jgi:hypothetical protein
MIFPVMTTRYSFVDPGIPQYAGCPSISLLSGLFFAAWSCSHATAIPKGRAFLFSSMYSSGAGVLFSLPTGEGRICEYSSLPLGDPPPISTLSCGEFLWGSCRSRQGKHSFCVRAFLSCHREERKRYMGIAFVTWRSLVHHSGLLVVGDRMVEIAASSLCSLRPHITYRLVFGSRSQKNHFHFIRHRRRSMIFPAMAVRGIP